METELCKLAFKYGTDKCPKIKHNYTPWYFKRFNKIRNKVKKVLEIGIGDMRYPMKHYHEKSPSLKMWRDFFPNAKIYGIDISRKGFYEDDRIKCFWCDSTSEEKVDKLLSEIGNDFDIVIDDGSHKWIDQSKTAKLLLPKLNKDVDYLIEDVAEPRHLIKSIPEFKCELITFSPLRYDDKIVIVKNK